MQVLSPEQKAKKEAALKAWRIANKERLKVYQKKYRAEHKAQTRASAVAWRLANPERVREHRKKFYRVHRDSVLADCKAWRESNLETKLASDLRWARANPERRAVARAKWRMANKDRGRALCSARRSRIKGLLHPSHDKGAEMRLIKEARILSTQSGKAHHVDHIIPVSYGGWHHHDNLQVLPDSLNFTKNANPFWETPGYKSWKDVPAELWPAELAEEYLKRILVGDGKTEQLPLAA